MRRVATHSLTAFLALLIPGTLAAQASPTSGPATLVGTVLDSGTGEPIPRASVCVALGPNVRDAHYRCAEVDSVGILRLDSLPLGRHLVTAYCATTRTFSKTLHVDSVDFHDATPVNRVWRSDTAGCDLMPRRTVSGEFRGHMTVGFEAGHFAPCPGNGGYALGDSAATRLGEFATWVAFSDQAMHSTAWPDVPAAETHRFYVHVRGTVTGPGRYGHMGLGRYLLQVDTVLTIRLPGSADCLATRGRP